MDLTKLRNHSIGDLVRRKLLYTLFRQSWNVGITRHPAETVAGLEGLKKQRQALDDLLWMTEKRDSFAADPFIIHRRNQDDYLIFYEYFPWSNKRGRIDCVQFRDGRYSTSNVSLDSPFHLSYPCTFNDGDSCFIMPEHAESRNISLYNFDEKGSFHDGNSIVSDMSLLDGTMLLHRGKYWIFATKPGLHENRDLYIYHSDTLDGPWLEHRQNPVKQDKANARPAGQFIQYAGNLFRPAQDCTSHYGSGITVNRLKVLNEEVFEEEPVSEIRPKPGGRYDFGLHTISSSGEYTAIDGARLESRIHPVLDGASAYLR